MSLEVFEATLNHDAVIENRQRTPDGQGGWLISYVSPETVRGRIRPASGSEREVAQQEERQLTHVLYVVAGTAIGRGDRVTVRDLVVDVEGVREPSLDSHHLEVDCFERQVETDEDES